MSVIEIKAACEGVLNASPMDYEAACEVWTRVCTPQAVLAALPAGTCGECRHLQLGDNEELGELRLCTYGCWMYTDEWCSRYEPRKDATS